jgi:hypothetical protein
MRSTKYRFGIEYQQRRQIHLAKIYRRKLQEYVRQSQAGNLNMETIIIRLKNLGIR